MAYVANEIFRQSFTNTERIIVTHNQDVEYPAVRVLVDNEARPDLILAILVDEEDPTNRLLVRLRSPQTGVVQILNYDFQPVGIQSATLLALLDQGTRLNFGEDYNYIEDLPNSNTNSLTFVSRLLLNVNLAKLGRYRIATSFTWAYSDASQNFKAQLLVDGSNVAWSMEQEPKDSAATQQAFAHGQSEITLLDGAHTIDLQYAVSTGGDFSTIGQARLEFWRV